MFREQSKCHTHTPSLHFVPAPKSPEAGRATPRSILNTAKFMSRQHTVTALEEWELFRLPGSSTYIWTTYMRTQTCDVCHWLCGGGGGGRIHFISLLSSWTGLSICQAQSFLSKSIKLSCRINSAFLSLFPPGSAESREPDGKKHFVVSVCFLCCTFEVDRKLHIRIDLVDCVSCYVKFKKKKTFHTCKTRLILWLLDKGVTLC